MNFRYVARVLGMLICFISMTMVLPLSWSVFREEWASVYDFILSILVGLVIGMGLFFFGRRAEQEFFRREGLAVVTLGWVLGAAVGALPFYLCNEFNVEGEGSYIDAFFEAMSGFTTTGSTVLSNIEVLPEGIMLWRSFTQWLGGMGIVVLFVAFLPALGVHAKHLYKVEVPGIKKEGATPKISDAASLLWKIYLFFTVSETVLLRLAGMSWFDALNHTFTTLATGGFSTRNASIAHYDSPAIEAVIIVFMVLVGINFALFISLIRRRYREVTRDTELRTYLIIIAVATVLVLLNVLYGKSQHANAPDYAELGFGRAVRDSVFQVVSIVTTTGYCTADFNTWPPFSRIALVALMFVGGCAGSTGGSMKVSRLIVCVKMGVNQVRKFFFPRVVRRVKIGGKAMPEETIQLVTGFVLLFVAVWALGSIFMAALGLDLETASTSVIAALGNIGPGLAGVGAIENYGRIPEAGKIFLAFCMVLGRLELFTVLVLFVPEFWKE